MVALLIAVSLVLTSVIGIGFAAEKAAVGDIKDENTTDGLQVTVPENSGVSSAKEQEFTPTEPSTSTEETKPSKPAKPSESKDEPEEVKEEDGHEHIFGLPIKSGEMTHTRWCIKCGKVGQSETHRFLYRGEVEPSEEYPNGGKLYQCPLCGYGYVE